MPFDPSEILLMIGRNFTNLFPIRMVNEYQQSVRLTRGRLGSTGGPGIKFYIPFYQSLEIVDVRDGNLPLGEITTDTKDNETVTANGILIYGVNDANRYIHYIDDEDMEETVRGIAAHYVRSALYDRYELIERGNKSTLDSIVRGINKELVERKYGLDARGLKFDLLTKAPLNIRLIQS